jgi:hypothetical protein
LIGNSARREGTVPAHDYRDVELSPMAEIDISKELDNHVKIYPVSSLWPRVNVG